MSLLLCSSREQVISRWKDLLVEEELYEAHSFEYLHSLCVQFKAGILFLDGGMVDWQALRKLCRQNMETKVFLFSDRPAVTQGAAGIACGCLGYGNTYMTKSQLVTAVETLRQGKVWLGRSLKHYLLKK